MGDAMDIGRKLANDREAATELLAEARLRSVEWVGAWSDAVISARASPEGVPELL